MSESVSAGVIIYKAFMPTFMMFMVIVIGFLAAKRDILTPAGAKVLGSIMVGITMPALVFSSMVSAFTPENVKAIGPLLLAAFMFQMLGVLLAWITREIFYVPTDFRWGILVCGICSNWGYGPTAILQAIATSAPFDPEVDVDLGVAYLSIFAAYMQTTFWGLGVNKLCGWDYREDRRSVKAPLLRRQLKSIKNLILHKDGKDKASTIQVDPEFQATLEFETIQDKGTGTPFTQVDIEPFIPSTTAGSSHTVIPIHQIANSGSGQYSASVHKRSVLDNDRTNPVQPDNQPSLGVDTQRDKTSSKPIWKRMILIIVNQPNVTKAIILSIPLATIQPLKALFVATSGWSGGRMPNAPDGNPPLHIIIQITAYLGAMAVPGALLCLGASFARLKMPKNLHDLPYGAIISLTVSKMIIVPVFAIFVIQAMRDKTSLFPREDKIRTFATLLVSGSPSQVIQVVVTQSYNPDGTAETLSSFLIVQYSLTLILSTQVTFSWFHALAAIALYIVEK
ncbi:uncharacterized protein L201_007556 [Kwoniella dendrophila CBS 6074]|uniref:Auxin efflux carrier n=1 Tax=Kwoniella dendrophila CBS 6074 TaxID=1295534 RepID=A0AAX4K4Q2_9TREE